MLLVTGITGHSGKYFLQELINHKYEENIRCVIRPTSDISLLNSSGLKIEKVIGDINDPEFINKSMVGVDAIIHIYNIYHSPMILEAAINNNVKKAILIHTTGIYSKFKNASQEYKEIEKKIVKIVNDSNCTTSITILRPTMIYGDLCDHNMSKFIRIVDKFSIIPVINGGNSLLQPVNARDLGKAYYTVFMSNCNNAELKTYDLSGNKPIKIIDVLRLISHELNKKTIFISVPLVLGVFMAKFLKIITIGNIDLVEKVQRMGENRSYCHEEATRNFGYSPMSFETGIKIEVKEYLQKYKTNE